MGSFDDSPAESRDMLSDKGYYDSRCLASSTPPVARHLRWSYQPWPDRKPSGSRRPTGASSSSRNRDKLWGIKPCYAIFARGIPLTDVGLVSPETHHERGRSPPPHSRWVIVVPSTKLGTDLVKESLKRGMIVPIGVVFGITANMTASRLTAS